MLSITGNKTGSINTAGLASKKNAPDLIVLVRKLNITARPKLALNQRSLEIHLLAKPALKNEVVMISNVTYFEITTSYQKLYYF